MNISINKFPLWLLLIIITLILLPGVFTSFELCDSGFYLTFYDNFYSAPESVEYNFMYYLTGIIGGAVDSFGDTYGVLRMRITGLIFLLASAAITWCYDRQVVSPKVTAIAIICVMAAYSDAPIIVSYDIITLFLLSIVVLFLVRGILCDNNKYIFLSGLFAGILIFVRIPNVLQFFLIFLIPIYSSGTKKRKFILTTLFAVGYICGIGAVMGFMSICGHLTIFIKNMQTLINLSMDPEASHGIGKLILTQLKYYFILLNLMVKFLVLILGLWAITKYIEKLWVKVLCIVPIALYFISVCMRAMGIGIIGAITIPALLFIMIKSRKGKDGVIAAAALFSALILPLGSDGAANMGSIVYLIGAAPAFGYWLNFRIRLKNVYIFFPNRSLWSGSIVFAIVCIVRTLCCGLYFDDNPIWKMTSRSSIPQLQGLRISEGRVAIIDEAVEMINQYVSPGDTLMVYGSSPMLNYLTSTKPYINNSWPEQYSAFTLDYLLREEEKKGLLPVVCVQRFYTIGSHWGKPSDAFMRGEDADSNVYHSAKKWIVMEDFLNRNGYQKVAATPYFDILTR